MASNHEKNWQSLKTYLEDMKDMALAEAASYSKNKDNLYRNSDEMAWGCRCRANACDLVLAKMKRLENKTND